jgi:hypothetical protein
VFSELDNELQESFRAYIAVSGACCNNSYWSTLRVLCNAADQAAGLGAVVLARWFDVVQQHSCPAEGIG